MKSYTTRHFCRLFAWLPRHVQQQTRQAYRLFRQDATHPRLHFKRVHAEALAGKGVAISLTNCYRQNDFGDPIVALKSYVLSPFADDNQMQSVVAHVVAARRLVDQASSAKP